jgi:diacylglycerol kinase family enzyme
MTAQAQRFPGVAEREHRDAGAPPLLVIVNGKASGVGDATVIAQRAVAALAEAGGSATAVVTRSLGELAAVVRDADGHRLVLAGGDGAVHALANLDGPLPPAALLPAGRANNIASVLGVPADWHDAAAVAVGGVVRAVDALEVRTPSQRVVAVEGVSAGFHAAARHRYGAENSAALTEGVRALLAELAAFTPYDAEVDLDGAPFHDGALAQVFLSNLPLFGFGFRVDPVARADDGLLEAIVLDARTRTGVVRLLGAARDGGHLQREAVTWARAGEARLATPMPLVADAEPLGVTTARVSVLPGHLQLVGPAEAAA